MDRLRRPIRRCAGIRCSPGLDLNRERGRIDHRRRRKVASGAGSRHPWRRGDDWRSRSGRSRQGEAWRWPGPAQARVGLQGLRILSGRSSRLRAFPNGRYFRCRARETGPEIGIAMIAGEQRGRESALLLAAILDLGTAIMLLLVGMAVSSLTCVAEGLRAGLMVLIDFVSLVVIRRIHRGSLVGYEFGTGKLEHLCSLLVAAGLAGGALWVGTAALQLAISGRSEATPLGLALAAIGGSINLCANLVAWDGVRRTAEGRPSAIMRAQMRSRWTKLLASMTVQVTMTAAAWAKDPNLAAAADAAGALVVCAVMAGAAWAMVAEALPGLLDRSARDLAEPALL